MPELYSAASFAAASDNSQSLLDFAPWWVRLIVGIVMVVIAGTIYYWDKRRPAQSGWDILDFIEFAFGLGGLYIILQAIGIF